MLIEQYKEESSRHLDFTFSGLKKLKISDIGAKDNLLSGNAELC